MTACYSVALWGSRIVTNVAHLRIVRRVTANWYWAADGFAKRLLSTASNVQSAGNRQDK
jgi:hypothetical protein